MNTFPPIGSRVRFTRSDKPERTITGTVLAHYPGHPFTDKESGEYIEVEDHACVQVDSVPDWWAYPNTDKFAPEISELEII